VLGAVFLRERVGWRQATGLALGVVGVALVATARTDQGVSPRDVAILGLAPLCWSVYTIVTKPVLRTVSPLTWTYLVVIAGGVPLALLAPVAGGPAMASLDARGWALVLYLSLVATVLGNAVWSWLLRHLTAGTTGLTVFLNPPLTTASKWFLATAFPLAFSFSIRPQEWVGGALAMGGVALAVLRPWDRAARASRGGDSRVAPIARPARSSDAAGASTR
jgi:drug/metabolite transporter (DMT)-like permease